MSLHFTGCDNFILRVEVTGRSGDHKYQQDSSSENHDIFQALQICKTWKNIKVVNGEGDKYTVILVHLVLKKQSLVSSGCTGMVSFSLLLSFQQSVKNIYFNLLTIFSAIAQHAVSSVFDWFPWTVTRADPRSCIMHPSSMHYPLMLAVVASILSVDALCLIVSITTWHICLMPQKLRIEFGGWR